MDKDELSTVANKLVHDSKGILAIDESPKSMEKKFAKVGIQNTEENRRRYREMLLTCPHEIAEYLSGVILNEETFLQCTDSGIPFVDIVKASGILPGVKLDKGLLPLNSEAKEKMSTGLDDLSTRCKQYKDGGAAFAKWRSVFTIQKGMPTEECIYKNCSILSEYALVCQKNGLVPVVEPEVLLDGAHNHEECKVVTASVISCLFYHLNRKGVHIAGMLLKVGFVTPGSGTQQQSLDVVANATIDAFMSSVPPRVPGIVFLSGGHAEDVSVEYLKHANSVKREQNAPWRMSYSFGRALQDSALKLWNNEDTKKTQAQQLLIHRARMCSYAIQGKE